MKKIKIEMDMPPNCYECPMSYETEGCYSDVCQLYHYLCGNDDFDAKIYDFRQSVPEWCPLLKFDEVRE